MIYTLLIKKTNVLEKEEKELTEEEELNKFILNHLCGEIMEVMDLGNDQVDLIASKTKHVAEPPELSRLKCAGHHHKGNIDSNALQTE